MSTDPPTRYITVCCDGCYHEESFVTDNITYQVGHAWEQPCNECGYNWSTITGVGA